MYMYHIINTSTYDTHGLRDNVTTSELAKIINEHTAEAYQAKTHAEARRVLNSRLSVDGARGLFAVTPDRAICASLYEGEDWTQKVKK